MNTTTLETLRAELAAAVEAFNANEVDAADPVARLEIVAHLTTLRDRIKAQERAELRAVRGVVTGNACAGGIVKMKGTSSPC
jgi:hypothetical protein